jgi:hypothetical protein
MQQAHSDRLGFRVTIRSDSCAGKYTQLRAALPVVSDEPLIGQSLFSKTLSRVLLDLNFRARKVIHDLITKEKGTLYLQRKVVKRLLPGALSAGRAVTALAAPSCSRVWSRSAQRKERS